ncbi:MAG: radical SAM protein [Armatimonadetes bacterium]|nr:radical SAM protein [Armatimonadota bacterium]
MREVIYETQKEQGRLEEAGLFPRVVLIDTVSFCNLRCSMCVHKEMTRPRGYMSWELFTKIVDEIAVENPAARVWMVFFGEALMLRKRKPTIFDKIRYAKEKGLQDVVLNSNANLMDEEAARGLIEAGLDAIYIGIDAHTPDTYAQVRVGGDHERVRENTRRLIRLKEQLGARTPEVFVQFVEMDVNAHEKQSFIDYWNSQGANVKIRPKVSWAGSIDAPNLVLGNEDRWPCYWAMQSMSITDQGKVVTCAVDLDARHVAGDVTRQTLKEVWNGGLAELRQKHLTRNWDALPKVCRDCRDWQSARADYFALNPD